jgi:hypothetical protein
MSEPQAEIKSSVDPLEQWRALRDAYMDTWAKAMGETVKSEAYNQANGAMLETFLTTSAPYREAQKKLMVGALEQLNMPSRGDFISLAERLANLEMLLDDMAAKLSEVHKLAVIAVAQTAPAKPEATKAHVAPIAESAPSEVAPGTKSAPHKTSSNTAKKRTKQHVKVH